jgi:biopolymer transport protein ExbB
MPRFRTVLLLSFLLLLPVLLAGETNTAAAGAGAPAVSHGIAYYFRLGGPFMYLLLLFSVGGLAIVIERMVVFSRIKIIDKGFEEEVLAAAEAGHIPRLAKACEAVDTEVGRILLSGLNSLKKGPERMEKVIEATAELQVSIMERGLNLLSSIANLAPLVGLIGAFSSIAEAENVSAKLVAGGIFEALITTAAGLIVAIPIMIFHNYFVQRVDRFVTTVERLTLGIMERLGNKGKL